MKVHYSKLKLVMAHLKTKATQRSPQQRYQWKLTLIKGLYEKGYTRENVLSLFRFINWMMALPDVLEQQLEIELSTYEEERRMLYITPLERRAIQRGKLEERRETVLEVLETRFGTVPEAIATQINSIEEVDVLKGLLRQATIVPDLETFQPSLSEHGKNATESEASPKVAEN